MEILLLNEFNWKKKKWLIPFSYNLEGEEAEEGEGDEEGEDEGETGGEGDTAEEGETAEEGDTAEESQEETEGGEKKEVLFYWKGMGVGLMVYACSDC